MGTSIYAVVFVDYQSKWPYIFPAKDQSAYTIAKMLVEKIIPKHGVPAQLLSDHGTAFLSKLLAEVYKLMGMKKLNTTAYHPQTDTLVERFNRTLLDMLFAICLICILCEPTVLNRRITLLPAVWEGPQVAHRSCSVATTRFYFPVGL